MINPAHRLGRSNRGHRLFNVAWTVSVLIMMPLSGLGYTVRTDTQPITQAGVPKLLVEARCNACHDKEEARIGPPYLAIASRYRNANEQTINALTQKILTGGAGNWGFMPMVASPTVTPQQAREVVRWILAIKPSDKSRMASDSKK